MNKTYLFMAAAVVSLILLGFYFSEAKAEKQYKDEIDIQVPDDSQYRKTNCSFTNVGEWLIYGCKWFFDSQTPGEWIKQKDEIFQKELEEKQKEAEEKQTPEETPLTPTERLIQRLEEDKETGRQGAADGELLKLLITLNDKCFFGIEEGYPIQKFGQFLLPEYDPRGSLYSKSLDLSKYPKLGEVLKLLEACESWTKYKSDNLRQYLDIEHDSFLDTETTTHAHAADGIDPIPSQKFYPELVKSNEERAKMTICNFNYYGDAYKKQQGCVIQYGSEIADFKDPRQLTEIQKEAHRRAGEICDPRYNFPMSYKLDMGCQLLVTPEYELERSSNVDIPNNKVFQDWFYYDQTGEDQQLQKIKQRNLEKHYEERNK